MTPQDDELTPEERALFAALPREREPGRLLEERVVRALRGRGALEAGGRRARIPAAWLGGAVAASLALFTTGVAVGQWMGARSTAQVVERIQAENTRQASLLVQQTGSAYVQALGQLAQQTSGGAHPAQAAQAREVAVRGLRAAADELVRIAPDDPVAGGIVAGFDRSRAARPDSAAGPKVVWF